MDIVPDRSDPWWKAQISLASRRGTWFGHYLSDSTREQEGTRDGERKNEREPMVGPDDSLSRADASVGCEGRRPDIARIPSRPRRAVERHEFRAIMWTSARPECLKYRYFTFTWPRDKVKICILIPWRPWISDGNFVIPYCLDIKRSILIFA